jgi:hypothetical protein
MHSRLSTKQTLRALAMLLAFTGVISFTRSSAPVYAQSATASLSGVAMDEKGAVVAGAKITLVNAATALKREAKTNSDGLFTLPLLPPGNYTVSAQCDGFRPVDLRDITLNVGDQRSVQITLRVGSVTASVEVAGGTSLLNESPAVSTIVDRQFVANQPLNGRSFQSLITLSPGVALAKTNVTTAGQFNVNGQRANTNYFTVDGVSANFATTGAGTLYESSGGALPAFSIQGGTNSLASVDAVQEFAIQTSTYAPEFGRQSGAQVSIVTRSGTNDFHGAAFNYLRNDVFDANDYFANRNRLRKPPLRQNDFGFTLGGPMSLPRFGEGGHALYQGRDRTFFFVSYEGLRLRQPFVSDPIPAPSLAARQSATGIVRDLLNAYPLPNGAPLASDPNTATFISSWSNPSTLDATSVRIDHTVNNWLTVFGRYNHAPSSAQVRANFSTPNTIENGTAKTQTLTLGSAMIFSARVSNDLRVNYSQSRAGTTYELDNFGGAITPPVSSLYPSFASRDNDLSYVQIGPATAALTDGLNSANQQRQFNLVDTLSWTAGGHALKFGVDYRRLAPINRGAIYRRFLFYTTVAQVLSGSVPTFSATSTDVTLEPLYHNFSAFVQDTWKATRRLTLTYGLRYEVNPAPTERNDKLPATVTGLENPAMLALAPANTRFYDTTFKNFAPRIGAAYQLFPNRGTVIRGGFGVFYDLGTAFTGSAFFNSIFPYGRAARGTNVPLDSALVTSPPPPVNTNPPYPAIFAYTPDYDLPYTLQYNVAIEQSLGASNSLSLSYVGANGRRLGRVERLRNPNANFTLVSVVRDEAESDYHALQAQFQRRLARGLQALVSYTWAKSLDTVSDESITNYQAPLSSLNPRLDRGPSSFDVRHALSAAISYDLPSPFAAGVGRAIFGGFGVDSIIAARSATPVNVLTGTDPFGFGFATVTRPDLVAGQPLYLDDPLVAGGRRFNRAAFALPPAGRQGTLGRNVLRGFPLAQWDVSLRRQFNLTERLNLQVRADAFNVLNHANFAEPTGLLNNPNFGVSTQMLGRSLGGLNALYQVGGPRSMQMSLKLQF